jgi:hypothetical protein
MKDGNFCQVCLLESAITELFTQAIQKGHITLPESCGLMAALLTNSLSEDERDLINRLLYAVRRGRLKVVDEH